MATRNQFDFLAGVQPTGTGALQDLECDDRVCSSLTIQLAGTFTLTVTWQGTVDGTNWSSIVATDLSSATGTAASTATAPGLYRIDTTGLFSVRPNITAFTSITASSFVCKANGVQG